MIKTLYKIYIFLIFFFNNFSNRLKLYFFNCTTGDNLKINGSLFIKGRGILEIGDDVIINSNHVFNPIGGQGVTSIVVDEGAKLLLGSQVGISNSAFYCTTGITIEDNVLIGGSCKIWDTDFHSLDKNIRGTKYDKGISLPVRIKKNAFIGASSIILKGVTIGENSIIGAGSIVTKSVPCNEIWGGNPAKFIRKIDEE